VSSNVTEYHNCTSYHLQNHLQHGIDGESLAKKRRLEESQVLATIRYKPFQNEHEAYPI
jgi:hypothetical protein